MKNLRIFATALVLMLLTFACQDNFEVAPGPEALTFEQGEIALPNQKGEVIEAYYLGNLVSLEMIDGQYIYQSDIAIPESQLSFIAPPEATLSTESVGRTGGRWANNTVYYQIDSSLPNQQRVTDAIAHWEANTSLRFFVRTSQTDYIVFRPSSGCSSSLGRVGGRQYINLASGCSTGNTIHEIGHAVGLYHEQSRADRDNYIDILFENVQSGAQGNFYTYVQTGSDGQDLTNDLDLGSIMMYGSFFFSKNGQPTITRLNGTTFEVQRNALSADDIAGIDIMYPGNGGGGGQQYINGQYYTIDGLRVYRYNDRWYWYGNGRNGTQWYEVVNQNGSWYYA